MHNKPQHYKLIIKCQYFYTHTNANLYISHNIKKLTSIPFKNDSHINRPKQKNGTTTQFQINPKKKTQPLRTNRKFLIINPKAISHREKGRIAHS